MGSFQEGVFSRGGGCFLDQIYQALILSNQLGGLKRRAFLLIIADDPGAEEDVRAKVLGIRRGEGGSHE